MVAVDVGQGGRRYGAPRARPNSLAQRHHAYMVEWLAKDPDSFEPIYEGPEWSVPAWCAGFILGTTRQAPVGSPGRQPP
jgi:uncharacterized protein